MLINARPKAPSWISTIDSKLKVEKVVNAPRKPTDNPNLISGLTSGRSIRYTAKNPNIQDPRAFTVRVP